MSHSVDKLRMVFSGDCKESCSKPVATRTRPRGPAFATLWAAKLMESSWRRSRSPWIKTVSLGLIMGVNLEAEPVRLKQNIVLK